MGMELTNVSDLKLALQLAGIRTSKSLGQHFLIDQASLEAVMTAAELTKSDMVLEIGPGLGVMTTPLTKLAGQVVAVETDPRLAELLKHDRPANLEVVHQDIMQFDLSRMAGGYKVVSNIPYYLTSAIFRLLLEAKNRPSIFSLLIQKEVAERIVAKPGRMSILALSVQYYGEPELVRMVERYKFWPAPKVDSAILRVRVYEQPAFAADPAKLFRLIKAGFGEKRKMLKNSLAGGLNMGMELAARLIDEAGLPPLSRAQELSMDQWRKLYERFIHYEII